MAERIDHVAEANATAKQTLSYGAYGEDAGAVVSMLAAQVHATLALVEQQRIANRLKVAELDLTDEIGYRQNGGYALDFRIRPYLDADDWAAIEVVDEEARDAD